MSGDLVGEFGCKIKELELELKDVAEKLASMEDEIRRMNDEGNALIGDLKEHAGRLDVAIKATREAAAALSALERPRNIRTASAVAV